MHGQESPPQALVQSQHFTDEGSWQCAVNPDGGNNHRRQRPGGKWEGLGFTHRLRVGADLQDGQHHGIGGGRLRSQRIDYALKCQQHLHRQPPFAAIWRTVALFQAAVQTSCGG